MKLQDRGEAGRLLAPLVRRERLSGPVILGLGGGGLAVAAQIARAVGADLDVLEVEQLDLGDALHPPMRIGAVADTGQVVVNQDVLAKLHLAPGSVDAAVARARQEIDRRSATYLGRRERPSLEGRSAVIVDDATSDPALLHAALDVARAAHPLRVVLALPCAPQETLYDLEASSDAVLCLQTLPWLRWFSLHGNLYVDDRIPSGGELRQLLDTGAGGAQWPLRLLGK